jgi:hypothetical protein
MKSIEQLTKAQHDADFLVESLRGALADADAVEGLVLLALIADSSRLALNIGALIDATGDRERCDRTLDWDLIGKVMVAHDISGDIAPGESESQFIARLIDEAYTKTDQVKPITADDELITIELKDNVLSLGELEGAANGYADVDDERGSVMVDLLKAHAGQNKVTMSRDDWITLSDCLRRAKDYGAAAYIEAALNGGTDDPEDPMGVKWVVLKDSCQRP